ncbi:MAG: DUF2239 family protein [Gemmatimonadaceae bacterium]
MSPPALPASHSSAATDRVVVAFEGDRLVASGSFERVSESVRATQSGGQQGGILVFDARTSEQLEVDPRTAAGSSDPDVATMMVASDAEPPRGPGRPRLGVVAREVTLLPRHWEWLASQPGGASATLRRLVELARNTNAERDRVREAQESAYRFMSATLGNQPHYEEALRALFAGDGERFAGLTESWPRDLRDHARQVASAAFPSSPSPSSP